MGYAYAEEENGAGQRHQLFFAVLPDESARGAIANLARILRKVRQSYAKLIEPENLHVSVFAVDGYRGALPDDLFARATAAGAAVRAAPFRIAFNQTGTFVSPRATKVRNYPFVLFGDRDAGVSLTLRRVVGAAMRQHGLGYAVKDVKAFSPHVSLWWEEERHEAQPTAPVAWTARELVLIDSIQGEGKHNHLARWPLGG